MESPSFVRPDLAAANYPGGQATESDRSDLPPLSGTVSREDGDGFCPVHGIGYGKQSNPEGCPTCYRLKSK